LTLITHFAHTVSKSYNHPDGVGLAPYFLSQNVSGLSFCGERRAKQIPVFLNSAARPA